MKWLERHRFKQALKVAGAVAGVAVLTIVLYRVELQSDQLDSALAALKDEQQAAEDRGEDPVAPSPSELLDDPTYSPQPGGQAGPPPSDAQIEAAIQAYFDENPIEGEEPKPAEIAAAVANYLIDNPPKQGKQGPPPSAEQVATAVENYLDGKDLTGPKGEQGDPGRAPTAEEIAAAVEAYIDEHGFPMCPEGTQAETVEDVLTAGGPPIDAVICVKSELRIYRKKITMKNEPLLTTGVVTSLVSAAVALLVAFGVSLTEEQSTAIMSAAAVLAPLVVAFVARFKVSPKDRLRPPAPE